MFKSQIIPLLQSQHVDDVSKKKKKQMCRRKYSKSFVRDSGTCYITARPEERNRNDVFLTEHKQALPLCEYTYNRGNRSNWYLSREVRADWTVSAFQVIFNEDTVKRTLALHVLLAMQRGGGK